MLESSSSKPTKILFFFCIKNPSKYDSPGNTVNLEHPQEQSSSSIPAAHSRIPISRCQRIQRTSPSLQICQCSCGPTRNTYPRPWDKDSYPDRRQLQQTPFAFVVPLLSSGQNHPLANRLYRRGGTYSKPESVKNKFPVVFLPCRLCTIFSSFHHKGISLPTFHR